MPIRVGFLVGKDNDCVEDPKYRGDASFLSDLPNKYRVDPDSKEYLANCKKKGIKGLAHADVAIPWYIHKHNEDIEIDIILPEDISVKRLQSNLCNYIIGYDVINAVFEGKDRWAFMENAFKSCGNMLPSWEVQEFIYYKSRYMQACMDAGVPMAPTIFSIQGNRSAGQLLEQIKARGWRMFVLKQSFSAFSLGFMKLSVEECEAKPKILEDYFEEFAHIPEFIVQEAIPGFVRNWETRCFWFNGEFVYAIANKAAVSTDDGEEVIITGDDIPAEFLENAKRVGSAALKVLPQLRTPGGQPIDMTLIRTDIGCSDTPLDDKETQWDATDGKKTFFLNEIEYGGTNYFIRHLQFDAIPLWAEKFAAKVREVHSKDAQGKEGDSAAAEPQQKRSRTAGAVLKKPAAARA